MKSETELINTITTLIVIAVLAGGALFWLGVWAGWAAHGAGCP
jgi:hypothetical protein